MQSSDIQRFSEARHLSVSSLLPATAKSIPPGALAGYLKAQQAWRKSHASTKCAGQKSSRVQLQHFEYSGQSCSSQTSCSTADNYFRHPAYGLPAPGSKLVAQLLQSRHDLLARHRDQRQLAKRRRTREAQQEPSASLLSLPEDVLVCQNPCVSSGLLPCLPYTEIICCACSCTLCTSWTMKM